MTATAALAGLPPLAAWQTARGERGDAVLETFRRDPLIAREIAYFRENIAAAKTPKALTDDQRLFQFVLDAFGLEGQKNAHAYMRRILESDPLDKTSFVNRLADPKFVEINVEMGYGTFDAVNLNSRTWREQMVEKFLTWRYERAVGETNPDLRLALYAERRLGEVDSWYQVMGDKPLYEVVRKGLGLPDKMAGMDPERQKAVFERKIDLAAIKSGEGLAKTIRSFLARAEAERGPAPGSVPALAILSGGARIGLVQVSPALANQLMTLR